MATWQIKKMCLSCKHFRLIDDVSGICRVDKSMKELYPVKRNEDYCESWKDSGQQYFIRTGWIKAMRKKDE